MRALRRLFCTAALLGLSSLAALPAHAGASAPKDGVEYKTLPSPLPTDAGARKVEVIEFFAYYCPHCHAFEPLLEEWVRKQGDNIVFKRVHVPHGLVPQQRLFHTLDALGLLDQYHAKAFAAMHAERLRLASDEEVFDWAGRAGIDRTRFIDAYRSFGVQNRMFRARTLANEYGVTHWPMLAVDGRFLTSPGMAAAGAEGRPSETQLLQGALQVVDHLVAKAKAGKK